MRPEGQEDGYQRGAKRDGNRDRRDDQAIALPMIGAGTCLPHVPPLVALYASRQAVDLLIYVDR